MSEAFDKYSSLYCIIRMISFMADNGRFPTTMGLLSEAFDKYSSLSSLCCITYNEEDFFYGLINIHHHYDVNNIIIIK